MITFVFGWSNWLEESGSTSHCLLKSNASCWSVSFGVSKALDGGEAQLGLVSLLSPMSRLIVLVVQVTKLKTSNVKTCRMKCMPLVRNVCVELSHPLLDN